jgi:hypothetical protein
LCWGTYRVYIHVTTRTFRYQHFVSVYTADWCSRLRDRYSVARWRESEYGFVAIVARSVLPGHFILPSFLGISTSVRERPGRARLYGGPSGICNQPLKGGLRFDFRLLGTSFLSEQMEDTVGFYLHRESQLILL